MDLYIANGTRQVQTFVYRVAEVQQPRTQTIAIGGQIKISGNLNQLDIDKIIAQHVKYGLIRADEIDAAKSVAPLAWQVGKPITPDRIARLMARNAGVMVERGRQARKDAAVVAATNLGSSLRESGVPGELQELEVGLTEERTERTAPGEEMANETIVVNKGEEGEGGTETSGPARGRSGKSGGRGKGNR